jgi:GT2 family glycosyltransferase
VNATVEFGDLTGTYRTVYEVDPDVSVDVVVPVVDLKDMDDRAVQLRRALAMGGHERWQLVLAGADVAVQRCADALRNAGVSEERIRVTTSAPAVGAALGAAMRASQADHLLFVNDAVIARADGWLRTLLGFSGQPGVAAVGAKVLAFDGRVEHAGVVIGDGLPLPVYHGADGDELGHLATLVTTVNRSAVTGVAMAPRAAIDAVGLDEAFDELALVDYCLRAADLGLRTLWTPDALVSLTRDGRSPRNDIAILAAFAQRWRSRIDADPFYNRELWQERADFTILEGS